MKPGLSDFARKLDKRIKVQEGEPVNSSENAGKAIRAMIHTQANKANATQK